MGHNFSFYIHYFVFFKKYFFILKFLMLNEKIDTIFWSQQPVSLSYDKEWTMALYKLHTYQQLLTLYTTL